MPKITSNCARCNKSFQAHASRAKYGRAKHCSRECQYAAVREAPSNAVGFTCTGCGKEFTRSLAKATKHKGAGRFCSRPCRDKNRVAKNHPQYKNAPRQYRGHNWQAQKRKARLRDHKTCQLCGAPGTDVHHLAPFRWFADPVLANDLENLITLCKSCHRRMDAELQKLPDPPVKVGHRITS